MSDPHATERFFRVVGKRQRPPAGKPPPPATRNAMTQMAAYRTRVPKGIFIYASHEAANRDMERWQLEAIRARQAELEPGGT